MKQLKYLFIFYLLLLMPFLGSATVIKTSFLTDIMVGNDSFGKSNRDLDNSTNVPPTIASFTPTSGTIGTKITITGTGFTGATAVSIQNLPASSFIVVSSTTITAIAAGQGTGDIITVTTPGGTASKGGYSYTSGPVIEYFTPTSAAQGEIVGIFGSNLWQTTAVSFGGTAATFNLPSEGFVVYGQVQKGSSGVVSVTTPSGTATLDGFTFIPAPSINSFTPTSAAPGSLVTITGTDFSGTTAVSFGGTPAAAYTIVSSTTITATVNTGTSGAVSVTSRGGTVSVPGFVLIGTPAPNITSFSPTSAANGESVVINGSDFQSTSAVSFGGTPAASFSIQSPNRIIAILGNGSTGDIVVTTPAGTANKPGFTFTTPPKITSFTPNIGTAGSIVTITGLNFTNTDVVSFGGVASPSFNIISPTTITATVGSGASGSVMVNTPKGVSTAPGFVFVSAPTITSFTPSSAPIASNVVITGTNFTGTTSVSFGGIPATSFTVFSPTSITAKVPNGNSGSITVSNQAGTASLAGFTFLPAPTLSSFSPSTGIAGTTITITGTNLNGVTDVICGTVHATSFTMISPTTLTAILGNGSTTDLNSKIIVTTTGGIANISGFTFFAPPRIDSFLPAVATTGSVINLIGINFIGATEIKIGGVISTPITVNNSGGTAVLGNGASGYITLTNPAGTATSRSPITFVPSPVLNASQTVFTTGKKVTLGLNSDPIYSVYWFKDGIQYGAPTNTTTLDVTQGGTYYAQIKLNVRPEYAVSNAVVITELFEVNQLSFKLQTTGETCRTSNNGIINITSTTGKNSFATIIGGNLNATYPFTTSMSFTDLSAGNYNVCITVEGKPEFKQCYDMVITEPKDLSLFIKVNESTNIVTVKMDGASLYTLNLNGKLYYTSSNEIDLPLKSGINNLTLSSEIVCQGVIEKIINYNQNIIYPNPFDNFLKIPTSAKKAFAEIRSLDGRILYSKTFPSLEGEVYIEPPSLASGFYILRLKLDDVESSYKILRK